MGVCQRDTTSKIFNRSRSHALSFRLESTQQKEEERWSGEMLVKNLKNPFFVAPIKSAYKIHLRATFSFTQAKILLRIDIMMILVGVPTFISFACQNANSSTTSSSDTKYKMRRFRIFTISFYYRKMNVNILCKQFLSTWICSFREHSKKEKLLMKCGRHSNKIGRFIIKLTTDDLRWRCHRFDIR